VTISARVVNLGDRDAEVSVGFGTEEQTLHEVTVTVAAGDATLAAFPEIALPAVPTPAWVAVTDDAMQADDVRRFVLRPIPEIRVLVVESPGAGDREVLYLRRVLAIGRDPALVTTVRTRPTAADIGAADVVILNDAPFPAGDAGRALVAWLEAGGGLLWAVGPRVRTIPESMREHVGQVTGSPVDRLSARGAVLGIADYGHPIFAPYRETRGGDFAAVRVYRYRRLTLPDSGQVLAWSDDGAPILSEARVGEGHALVWTSDFGNVWTDLAVRGVFLPTIHEAARYLARHEEPPAFYSVGQTLDPGALVDETVELVLEGPDGIRRPIAPGERDPVPLEAAGFYTLRPLEGGTGVPVAVNLDPAESDLTPLDEPAFVAAVEGPDDAGRVADAGLTLSPQERERRQRLWWYLTAAALAVLALESLLAGVRPRGMGT
jgi:hypothetical protein